MHRFILLIALASGFSFGQTSPDVAVKVLTFTHTDGAKNFQEIATALRTITDMKTATVDDVQKTVTLNGTADQLDLAEWLFSELDKIQVPDPNNRNSASLEFRMQDKNAENVVRVFYLSNTATVQNFQEAATAIRTITEFRRAFTYNAPRAFVVRGTADQTALAAWLIGQLQVSSLPASSTPEYRLPATAIGLGGGGRATVVKVLHTSQAATIKDFQELATAIRTITDLRFAFTFSPGKALLVRGEADQIALAEWILEQLDKPAIGQAAVQGISSSVAYQYDTSHDGDDIVRVFYLPQTETLEEFQKVATHIRETANLHRAFTYNSPRAFAVRGTIDQVATAERMVKDLDSPRQN